MCAVLGDLNAGHKGGEMVNNMNIVELQFDHLPNVICHIICVG